MDTEELEIYFEGHVKLNDWLKIGAKNFLVAYSFIIGVLALLALIDTYTDNSLFNQDPRVWPSIIIGMIVSLIILALMFILSIYHLKKEKGFEHISGTVTDNGIYIDQIGSENKIAWERYQKYKQFSTTLLLYTTPSAFQIIPKHLFKSESDWESFTRLVDAKIPKKKFS